jgi:hypothetical protein
MKIEHLVSLYAAGVGLAMVGMWTVLYLAGAIPELATAPLEIGMHLLAEGLTALALILSGFGVVRGWTRARPGLLTALGMLLYTVINSAGYYAQPGKATMVGMFAILTVATALALAALVLEWAPRRGEAELSGSARA